MKYTPEVLAEIIAKYEAKTTPKELALEYDVPERSIIAKLSALGVYKKKQYVTKRGEPPIKKEKYIEMIADLLDMDIDLLSSLEKVNKSVLIILVKTLQKEGENIFEA